jgi:hypothetical protein
MSLTYDETLRPLAYDSKSDEVIYYNDRHDGTMEAIGNFDVIPQLDFEVCHIVGAMGSGKSYWCSQYALSYKRIFPKNNIFLFSQKPTDKAFDDHPELKIRRIKFDEGFMKTKYDVATQKDFHDALIIFDDYMTIPDKKIVEKIVQLILQFITISRAYHCHVLITSHMFYGFKNRELYASIETEVNRLVWFQGVNVYQLRYVLHMYWGYENKQINKFIRFDNNSRYTLINKMPAYLMSKNKIRII